MGWPKDMNRIKKIKILKACIFLYLKGYSIRWVAQSLSQKNSLFLRWVAQKTFKVCIILFHILHASILYEKGSYISMGREGGRGIALQVAHFCIESSFTLSFRHSSIHVYPPCHPISLPRLLHTSSNKFKVA